jgi:isopentenyl diphosphate isomerase/L-lactate dehydrogenase-like FMN-dependent dehydrogenase
MDVSTTAKHTRSEQCRKNAQVEEIAQAASSPLWFQLYIYGSQEVARGLVRRAEAAGYQAMVLTVDLPTMGNRERSKRHGGPLPPPPLVEANFVGRALESLKIVPMTWEMVTWLRSLTSLPILLKGILTAEDARLAVEHGASGIIVSNHGGRPQSIAGECRCGSRAL